MAGHIKRPWTIVILVSVWLCTPAYKYKKKKKWAEGRRYLVSRQMSVALNKREFKELGPSHKPVYSCSLMCTHTHTHAILSSFSCTPLPLHKLSRLCSQEFPTLQAELKVVVSNSQHFPSWVKNRLRLHLKTWPHIFTLLLLRSDQICVTNRSRRALCVNTSLFSRALINLGCTQLLSRVGSDSRASGRHSGCWVSVCEKGRVRPGGVRRGLSLIHAVRTTRVTAPRSHQK